MSGLTARVREPCPARSAMTCGGLTLTLGARRLRAAVGAVALGTIAGAADEHGSPAAGTEKASGCDGHRLASADGCREYLERGGHTGRGCAKARLPGTTSPPWRLTRRGVVPDLHRPCGVYRRPEGAALDTVTSRACGQVSLPRPGPATSAQRRMSAGSDRWIRSRRRICAGWPEAHLQKSMSS